MSNLENDSQIARHGKGAGEMPSSVATRTACRAIRCLLPCLLIGLSPDYLHAQQSKATTERPGQIPLPSLRLHFSEQAFLLLFVDTMSQWSPYCTTVDLGFLGIPELDGLDHASLQRYAAARKPLGYFAETDLFLWAESGFRLEKRPTGYSELEAALDHFRKAPKFREPLSQRMKKIERYRPYLEQELVRIGEWMGSLRGVADVFRADDATRIKDVPLFIMPNLAPHSYPAGANGDGLYATVDPSDDPAHQLGRKNIFHEYLHLALRPGERFRAFTRADPHMEGWRQALGSKAPDERGDVETAMLEEIVVYALANVIVEGRDPEAQIRNYARRGNKQMVRTWDGVRILLPIIRHQVEKPASCEDFLSELISAFVGRVHHSVWSVPQGVVISEAGRR